jgi:hypothetical protein
VRAHDQYHVGIVVEDLDGAKTQLSDMFGYVWGTEMGGLTMVTLPSGPVELNLRLVYSVTEPRLELVQQIPGTLWEPAAGSGVHHLGFWSDDVAADGVELEAHGFAHEASGVSPDGSAMWAYHRSPTGPRIELVSRVLELVMSPFWTSPPEAPSA